MIEHSAGLSAIFMLGQIPGLILMPISFVLLPLAAAQHASGHELGRLLRRTILAGALITGTCCIGLALVAKPLLGLWRPEFAPYGQYVWIYALMTSLQGMTGVLAMIEMSRHEYRFLWLYSLPILLTCTALYIAQDHTTLTVTLPTVLWSLVTAHLVTFITIITQLTLRHTTIERVET